LTNVNQALRFVLPQNHLISLDMQYNKQRKRRPRASGPKCPVSPSSGKLNRYSQWECCWIKQSLGVTGAASPRFDALVIEFRNSRHAVVAVGEVISP